MTNPFVPNRFNRSPAANKEQRITWVGAIAKEANGWVEATMEGVMEQTVENLGLGQRAKRDLSPNTDKQLGKITGSN
jgi:hypothetical protein